MKKIFLMFLFLISGSALSFIDPKIGGTVRIRPDLAKNLTNTGVLYILAKKAGPDSSPGDKGLPIAVLKIARPRFPQAFVLTSRHVVKMGESLKGPMHVIARYSLSGNALDRKGVIEGLDPKFPSSEIGNNNLNIELTTLIK